MCMVNRSKGNHRWQRFALVGIAASLLAWCATGGPVWVACRTHAGPPTHFFAGREAGQRLADARTKLEWVWMPEGRFSFGCGGGAVSLTSGCLEDEVPAREAQLDGFWILRTEVTVDAFEGCVFDHQCGLPPEGKLCNWNRRGRSEHPINCVDRAAAEAFCRWLGARLPMAAEWEYAARSGSDVLFPWGTEPVDGRRANYCDRACAEALSPEESARWTEEGGIDEAEIDGHASTAPAASFPAGATRWGLLDMAGNVGEWTSTPFDSSGAAELRGGGWASSPDALRTTGRRSAVASKAGFDTGFRCARPFPQSCQVGPCRVPSRGAAGLPSAPP